MYCVLLFHLPVPLWSLAFCANRTVHPQAQRSISWYQGAPSAPIPCLGQPLGETCSQTFQYSLPPKLLLLELKVGLALQCKAESSWESCPCPSVVFLAYQASASGWWEEGVGSEQFSVVADLSTTFQDKCSLHIVTVALQGSKCRFRDGLLTKGGEPSSCLWQIHRVSPGPLRTLLARMSS